MSQHPVSLDAVLRLPGLALSQEEFETVLGRLDRVGTGRDGSQFGQLNLPEGSSWEELVTFIERVGAAVQPCLQRGEVGCPRVDIALYVHGAAASVLVPARAVRSLGRWGFDLEVSAYPVTMIM